jgi:hypothetical protein
VQPQDQLSACEFLVVREICRRAEADAFGRHEFQKRLPSIEAAKDRPRGNDFPARQ